MNGKDDLVRGWLRKARSDSLAADATLRAGIPDAACFHAQQAAEKYLKSFLTYHDVLFPYTHNLAKLLELCTQVEVSFHSLLPQVEPLTPYAVRLRYDDWFWPSLEVAEEARSAADAVCQFVLARLPKSFD